MQEEIANFNLILEQNDYDLGGIPWIEPKQSMDYTKFLNSVADIQSLQLEEIDSYLPFFPDVQSTQGSLHSNHQSEVPSPKASQQQEQSKQDDIENQDAFINQIVMKENETELKLKYFRKIIKMKQSFYFAKVSDIINYESNEQELRQKDSYHSSQQAQYLLLMKLMREQQENFITQAKYYQKHSKSIDKYLNKIYELEKKYFSQAEIHKLLIEKHKKNKKLMKQNNAPFKTQKASSSIKKKFSH